MIALKKLILHEMKMPLKHPFQNSQGTITEKRFHFVELIEESGISGFGESVAFESPWYTEETTDTVVMMIEKHIWPLIRHRTLQHPSEFQALTSSIQRNHMAKTAVEGAIWDLYARKKGEPLFKAIGGKQPRIEVGAAIGIQKDLPTLIEKIQQSIHAGYKRIKLKIAKGHDIEIVEAVRQAFPTLNLMVDANGAYTMEDIQHLQQLDRFQLMMIEQPLASDDLVDHARLQEKLETPICLDESIHTLADVRTAIAIGSCQIISMKLGKCGGFINAIAMHDECARQGIPVWCGGMLEAGIGRAQSLALATLPNFRFPADMGASNRYWHQDIIEPEIKVKDGIITLPELPGIGYTIDETALAEYRMEKRIIK